MRGIGLLLYRGLGLESRKLLVVSCPSNFTAQQGAIALAVRVLGQLSHRGYWSSPDRPVPLVLNGNILGKYAKFYNGDLL